MENRYSIATIYIIVAVLTKLGIAITILTTVGGIILTYYMLSNPYYFINLIIN